MLTVKNRRATLSMTVVLLVLFTGSLAAQPILTFPRQSPAAETQQRIGITDITINYHRPAVNDRKIFGDLVPYGQVWRAGANENTTISFTHEVTIGETSVPAGSYGLHILPEENEWEFILTETNTAWGSFSYDAAEDVLRVKAVPEESEFTEWLEYEITPGENNTAVVSIFWADTKASFDISVDVHEIVLANIRAELRGLPRFFWQGWNQAASYCLNNNINLEEAMAWADRAMAIQRNFNTLTTKSRLLMEMGQEEQAEELMAEAMETANEQQLNQYGYQLMNQGKLEKAHEIFVLNTEKHPESWNVWDSLGECLANMGETEEAIDNYEKALEMVSSMKTPPPGKQAERINGVLDKLKKQ